MHKITTHLWFDKEAKEAAELYVSTFSEAERQFGSTAPSKIKHVNTLEGTPSGSVDIVTIDLASQQFTLLSAGPLFKFTPAISFLIACDSKEEVDFFWQKLSKGGSVMMDLASYPFSEHYGWTADKFGVSWQIMHMGERKTKQKITPTLMFVGKVCGRAEEAVNFYTSVFHDAKVEHVMHYGKNEMPDKEGAVRHSGFSLEGLHFAAMDSAHAHKFTFNEAISFLVNCDTQAEIDYYWEKLSAVPESEQCGWLKDKFGVSWQIVPTHMDELLGSGDKAKIARVTKAFLQMKKFDITQLEAAGEGTLK